MDDLTRKIVIQHLQLAHDNNTAPTTELITWLDQMLLAVLSRSGQGITQQLDAGSRRSDGQREEPDERPRLPSDLNGKR